MKIYKVAYSHMALYKSENKTNVHKDKKLDQSKFYIPQIYW